MLVKGLTILMPHWLNQQNVNKKLWAVKPDNWIPLFNSDWSWLMHYSDWTTMQTVIHQSVIMTATVLLSNQNSFWRKWCLVPADHADRVPGQCQSRDWLDNHWITILLECHKGRDTWRIPACLQPKNSSGINVNHWDNADCSFCSEKGWLDGWFLQWYRRWWGRLILTFNLNMGGLDLFPGCLKSCQ